MQSWYILLGGYHRAGWCLALCTLFLSGGHTRAGERGLHPVYPQVLHPSRGGVAQALQETHVRRGAKQTPGLMAADSQTGRHPPLPDSCGRLSGYCTLGEVSGLYQVLLSPLPTDPLTGPGCFLVGALVRALPSSPISCLLRYPGFVGKCFALKSYLWGLGDPSMGGGVTITFLHVSSPLTPASGMCRKPGPLLISLSRACELGCLAHMLPHRPGPGLGLCGW